MIRNRQHLNSTHKKEQRKREKLFWMSKGIATFWTNDGSRRTVQRMKGTNMLSHLHNRWRIVHREFSYPDLPFEVVLSILSDLLRYDCRDRLIPWLTHYSITLEKIIKIPEWWRKSSLHFSITQTNANRRDKKGVEVRWACSQDEKSKFQLKRDPSFGYCLSTCFLYRC